jgi:regulator of nonsense transcripts 1
VLTIDGAQGREYDVVFISMVRTNGGSFIDDHRRINVALTRARHGLVIVGDATTLASSSSDWKVLLK